jgi:hypothetical protein
MAGVEVLPRERSGPMTALLYLLGEIFSIVGEVLKMIGRHFL